jgi:hypothetical protein
VTCAIGPSFTTSQLIFSSKTWFFGIYLNFQSKKSVKSQDFPHFGSKSYQINSTKSCSSRSNNTKDTFQFLRNFQLWFNFIFSVKNQSIFKNFCATSPKVMEPSPCTPPCQELSKDTKNTIWSILVWWIS